MIVLPKKGVARSTNKDNCDPITICDWIEASCLFVFDSLSVNDVVDVLVEEEVYSNQTLASNYIQDRWVEIQRRQSLTGSSLGVSIEDGWIHRKSEWKKYPAHAFCLLLSLATKYDWWHDEFGSSYAEQGELFELLTQESLRTLTPDWDCHISGWSRNSTTPFEELVADVAERIGDGTVRIEDWKDSQQKDLTLDLLYYNRFLDELPGIPVAFIQCASGADWKKKIGKPSLNAWNDVVRVFTPPLKGFAVPFCYTDDEFKRCAVRAEGLLLDRLRILSAGLKRQTWLSPNLESRIVDWSESRIDRLICKSS
ncbi:hypothetical protein [Rhodopirellula baltica]|uniref:Uncharacterized protein n=1 Tax=Rhodopirellula baltica WH47 TaxID=991778 RepID=F2AZG4_RHOBT|nr:hypothetical protein [Rhodopirellula baltica]EGF24919.1 hypothetical protein RBWH47_05679 [Rhodopirellula baltica WH47]